MVFFCSHCSHFYHNSYKGFFTRYQRGRVRVFHIVGVYGGKVRTNESPVFARIEVLLFLENLTFLELFREIRVLTSKCEHHLLKRLYIITAHIIRRQLQTNKACWTPHNTASFGETGFPTAIRYNQTIRFQIALY